MNSTTKIIFKRWLWGLGGLLVVFALAWKLERLATLALMSFLVAYVLNPLVTRMAAIILLMAIWWMTEAIPLAATALVPIAAFPILGIMAGKNVASNYISSTIFLFIGGFMIALAMEKWDLHKRIALGIIRAIGGGPDRLVLSFMLATHCAPNRLPSLSVLTSRSWQK